MAEYIAYPDGRILLNEPGTPLENGKLFDHYPTKQDLQSIGVRSKIPKAQNVLENEVRILPDNQRNKLVNAICARFLMNDPRFAEDLGIDISGDEDAH